MVVRGLDGVVGLVGCIGLYLERVLMLLGFSGRFGRVRSLGDLFVGIFF